MNDFSNNHCLPPADSSVPNLQVIRMTLLCDSAPAPITMDLTGTLPVHPPPSGYSSPSSVAFLPNPVVDVVLCVASRTATRITDIPWSKASHPSCCCSLCMCGKTAMGVSTLEREETAKCLLTGQY